MSHVQHQHRRYRLFGVMKLSSLCPKVSLSLRLSYLTIGSQGLNFSLWMLRETGMYCANSGLGARVHCLTYTSGQGFQRNSMNPILQMWGNLNRAPVLVSSGVGLLTLPLMPCESQTQQQAAAGTHAVPRPCTLIQRAW